MAYLSFGQATNDAMREAMRADEKVIVMGLDIRWGGSFGQFRGLYDEFGDRVIDMPISESVIVADTKAFRPSMESIRPCDTSGSSMGVIFR